MRAIFVTGTDTGVGKTYVCGLLLKYLKDKGIKAVTQKWVQTGCRSFRETDIALHQRMAFLPEKKIDNQIPYVFKHPVSPHLAAALENRRISKKVIKNSFKALCRNNEYVIVEGAGGVLVPLNKNTLMIDLVKELRLPVLIVVHNKLGAINHALLTIEALKKRKIKMIGILFNNVKGQNPKILADNPKIVAKLAKVRVLGILPHTRSRNGYGWRAILEQIK